MGAVHLLQSWSFRCIHEIKVQDDHDNLREGMYPGELILLLCVGV